MGLRFGDLVLEKTALPVFTVREADVCFTISLHSKVNILHGNSGTGKTYFSDIVQIILRQGGDMLYSLSAEGFNLRVVQSLEAFSDVPECCCFHANMLKRCAYAVRGSKGDAMHSRYEAYVAGKIIEIGGGTYA